MDKHSTEAARPATVLFRRKTADNKSLQVWSDGELTAALGFRLKGGGRFKSVATALLVAGEAALFNFSEMPALCKAAKRLARRKGNQLTPGALRNLTLQLTEVT